jgi:hypothetical protein
MAIKEKGEMTTQISDHAEKGLVRLVIADLCEFGRDIASCFARVYLSYRLMISFDVEVGLAFSTAMLLGGARAFNTSTNWLWRSRALVQVRLESTQPSRARVLVLFLKGTRPETDIHDRGRAPPATTEDNSQQPDARSAPPNVPRSKNIPTRPPRRNL